MKAFVPSDSASRSVGADAVAHALAELVAGAGRPVELVRNGSRGLYWLEPMLEIEADGVRHAFGPVDAGDVPAIVGQDGGLNRSHARYLGPTDSIPALARQTRITFRRVGVTDPLSLADYRAHGGLEGLAAAIELAPADIVERVSASGLRGRGGAAFPTGVKWRTVLETGADQKYIVCNADEGDSGTFADRMLMEGDPYMLLEGMIIAGLAVGATEGFVYTRAEYPDAIDTLEQAVAELGAAGYLGDDVGGSGRAFRIEVREAAGAYICGEETSLLESLEGKRGMVRFRPPLPAVSGLFGCPTVVNNVISLATVPAILANGASAYEAYGIDRSRGTLTAQLAGNVARGGLYELPFGITLRELVFDIGGGTRSGRPVKAVQAGGPLGAYIPEAHFDTPLDYEAFAGIGAMIGHGGFVVFDDTVDLGRMARYAMAFCAIESCGKCTPCRIGAVRGVEVIDRIRAGERPEANRALLRDLCDTMVDGSLCALGGMAPFPVRSVLEHFPEAL
jgi:formate dehydrogenase iron-sulfur subunit